MTCPGCGGQVPRSRGPRARVWCSAGCKKRSEERTPKARARFNATRRRRNHAKRGRVCRYCARSDTTALWQAGDVCARCARQMRRATCPDCGGPFYRDASRNREHVEGCVADRVGSGCRARVEYVPTVYRVAL